MTQAVNVQLERGRTDQQRDPPRVPQAPSFLVLAKGMVSSQLCQSTIVLKGWVAPNQSGSRGGRWSHHSFQVMLPDGVIK